MKRPAYFPSWKGIWQYILDPASKKLPKILLILALIYLVFPFDLISDFAIVIGWLDDLGLNVLALWYVLKTAKAHQQHLSLKGKESYEHSDT